LPLKGAIIGLEGLKMLRFGADVERGKEMKIRIGNEYYIEDQAGSEAVIKVTAYSEKNRIVDYTVIETKSDYYEIGDTGWCYPEQMSN
jgi:hypothetical protein